MQDYCRCHNHISGLMHFCQRWFSQQFIITGRNQQQQVILPDSDTPCCEYSIIWKHLSEFKWQNYFFILLCWQAWPRRNKVVWMVNFARVIIHVTHTKVYIIWYYKNQCNEHFWVSVGVMHCRFITRFKPQVAETGFCRQKPIAFTSPAILHTVHTCI